MNYLINKSQYSLILETYKGKTDEQIFKEIKDFVEKNNIKYTLQLYKSEPPLGWEETKMWCQARKLNMFDDLGIINNKIERKSDDEIKQVAKQYKTINDFKKGSNSWYQIAQERCILDDLGLERVRHERPLESIEIEARKYKSRSEFEANDEYGYKKARLNGILDKVFPEKTDSEIEKEIRDFVKNNNLTYRTQLREPPVAPGWFEYGMYRKAEELGILNDMFPVKRKTQPKIPDDEAERQIRDFVKKNNIKSYTELFYTEPPPGWGKQVMCDRARKLGIVEDLFPEENLEWIGEKRVYEVLTEMGYKVMRGIKNSGEGVAIRQYTFNDCFSPKGTKGCHKLRMDFYLITNKGEEIVVEYNGKQHYIAQKVFGGEEALEFQKVKDKIKSDYCRENGIKLIVIPYTDYNKIKEIITSEITPYNKVQEGNIYIKNKNIMTKRIVRLTENDLTKLVSRVISENEQIVQMANVFMDAQNIVRSETEPNVFKINNDNGETLFHIYKDILIYYPPLERLIRGFFGPTITKRVILDWFNGKFGTQLSFTLPHEKFFGFMGLEKKREKIIKNTIYILKTERLENVCNIKKSLEDNNTIIIGINRNVDADEMREKIVSIIEDAYAGTYPRHINIEFSNC